MAACPRHPRPPKKTLEEHVKQQSEFLDSELRPRLDKALAGEGHVFFVDAAHFVFGTFLCCLWSFARVFIRAASGQTGRISTPFEEITGKLAPPIASICSMVVSREVASSRNANWADVRGSLLTACWSD